MLEKNNVIRLVYGLFERKGIHAVDWADIAEDIKAPESEIKALFKTKENLVLEYTKFSLDAFAEGIAALSMMELHPVQEIMEVSGRVGLMLVKQNPMSLVDVRDFPEAWQMNVDFYHEVGSNFVAHNLQRGMDEGLYRPEINVEIMKHVASKQIESYFDPLFLLNDKFMVSEMLMEGSKYFIYGISTPKGLEYFKKNYEDEFSFNL